MGGIPQIQAGNALTMGPAMQTIRLLPVVLLLLLIQGCGSIGPTRDVGDGVRLDKSAVELPEDQLLDVWVELFNPGQLPEDEEEAAGLSMEIREAEARFIPVHLRDTMEKTGYWGAVRVVPQGTEGAEMLVRGVILSSDGQALDLEISALDATGREWFKNRYKSNISSQVYRGSKTRMREAFQPLSNTSCRQWDCGDSYASGKRSI